MSLDRDPEALAFERSVMRLVVMIRMRRYRRLRFRFRPVKAKYY